MGNLFPFVARPDLVYIITYRRYF